MNPRISPAKQPRKPRSKKSVWQIIAVLAASAVVLAIYFLLANIGATYSWVAHAAMITYMLIPACLLIAYVVYNRGFVYKNVTADMLQADWSYEKKTALLESCRRREQTSKWMLILMIPFVLALMADALYMYVWLNLLAPFFTA